MLTRVFPFDVGQVGRAGVADGQTLLGHTLIPIHVHEVSRHRDLNRDTAVAGEKTSSKANAGICDKINMTGNRKK